MKYIGEDERYIQGECKRCGKTVDVQKSQCQRVPSGYNISSKVKCTCGEESIFIIRRSDEIFCPKCGSTQLTANKKGFGLGKAAVGSLLLGGVGLLGGFVGSNKVLITCLKCGHKWEPGKMY